MRYTFFPRLLAHTSSHRRALVVTAVLVYATSSPVAAQDEPRIILTKPDETTQQVCLQSGTAQLTVTDGQTFLAASALRDDLGCPAEPGPTPVINSFSFSPDPLDLTTNNCDTSGDGTDDAVCLFASWDITPAVDPTQCTLLQTSPDKFSMTPFEIDNPGDNGGDCCDFVGFEPVVNNLAWPVNQQTATVGDKTFRLECTPAADSGPIIASRSVNFTDNTSPLVIIDSFDIQQDMPQQGDTIDFSFNTTLQNNPSAPTCTLSSDTMGVIDDVQVQATGQIQSGTATVLPDAPTGIQNFTFSCRPDGMSDPTDTDTDTVDIQPGGGGGTVDCSNFPPPAGTSRDTSSTAFTSWNEVFGFWPGGSGNTETLNVRNGQFMALEFIASTENASQSFGGYSWGKPTQGLGPQANAVVSYSQCPGDFNPDIDLDGAMDPECVGAFLNGSVQWQFAGTGLSSCELEPDTTYFLNIIFGEAGDPSNSSCPSNETWCSHLGGVQ